MKRKLVTLLVFVVMVPFFAVCGEDEALAASDETFKVGAIYPLSGGNALLGNQCLAAARIAVAFVNEKGGVHGRMVELFEADAPDPTAATTEAGRLINQRGVQVVFGSLASGNAMAIAGVTDRNKVHLVESGGIADSVTDSGFKYVYRILDKGSLRGAAGAGYCEQLAKALAIPLNELKVAIIHEDSSYGTSVSDGAEKKLKELGCKVVYKEQYNTSITDMSALVLKIKSAQPDVLLTVSYINDAVLLVDTLQQYQTMPKVLMGCGAGNTDPNFAMTIGAISDGMFCTDMPTNLPLSVFDSNPELKATIERFRKEWLELHPQMKNVSIAAEAAFSGAYTFMQYILPKAATLDPDDVRKAALETELDLVSLGFGWNLGEDGQNYAASANVNQWQGGEVITVYPEKLKNGDVINVPLPIANY